ncbi:hypothetical protein [Cerasicoccus frondis]|uniref:hypothetical protein n=1 Tax=Cerasicoccus frondis TaxID=490090 RepID=UPI002852BD91|nr:hypothetical protein [Cerasicoccus frondis]
MKRLARDILIFLFLSFLALNGVGWALLKMGYMGQQVEAYWINERFQRAAKGDPQASVFVLGDSVAEQMYPTARYRGRITSYATVMPLTMAGQYYLLKEIAASNDLNGKTVALVVCPQSLGLDLDHLFSFHYVLKSFYNDESGLAGDPIIQTRLAMPWVASLSQMPIIRHSNWRPPPWLKYLDEDALQPVAGVSEFSQHYLIKMKELVEAEGGEFVILPAIQKASNRDLEVWANIEQHAQEYGIGSLFERYREQAVFMDDSLFPDGIHLHDANTIDENIFGL